jgi:hypothetical protein
VAGAVVVGLAGGLVAAAIQRKTTTTTTTTLNTTEGTAVETKTAESLAMKRRKKTV